MTVVVVSFIVCLLFFIGVGIASASRRKNTSDDYLLASRSVGPWVVALSAVATNNSGFMFVGLIGATYTEGLSSLALMGGWVIGDYFAWLVGIPKALRKPQANRSAPPNGLFAERLGGASVDAARQSTRERRRANRRRQEAQRAAFRAPRQLLYMDITLC